MRALLIAVLALSGIHAAGPRPPFVGGGGGGSAPSREEPFTMREFRTTIDDRWIGNAVAYGPFRDGQHPGGPQPSREELREDLRILSAHWSLIRLYGATGPSETLLELIREEHLDLKVMLGVWIAPEPVEEPPAGGGAAQPDVGPANRVEMEAAVRLAAAYPEIVTALCVGNETQVSWSDHRVSPDHLIACLREMRARTKAPVTTADDFSYWSAAESRAVAAEIDFIVVHAHPLWNGIQLADAPAWTRNALEGVRAAHPGAVLVLGETGWATRRHSEGEQARLIKGVVGEEEQARFHRELSDWIEAERVTTFFFEAFDENWKGGAHPDEVEKHWGLFRADRTAKTAMSAGR